MTRQRQIQLFGLAALTTALIAASYFFGTPKLAYAVVFVATYAAARIWARGDKPEL